MKNEFDFIINEQNKFCQKKEKRNLKLISYYNKCHIKYE